MATLCGIDLQAGEMDSELGGHGRGPGRTLGGSWTKAVAEDVEGRADGMSIREGDAQTQRWIECGG